MAVHPADLSIQTTVKSGGWWPGDRLEKKNREVLAREEAVYWKAVESVLNVLLLLCALLYCALRRALSCSPQHLKLAGKCVCFPLKPHPRQTQTETETETLVWGKTGQSTEALLSIAIKIMQINAQVPKGEQVVENNFQFVV